MSTSVRYRCPCCGAALTFGSHSQQLDCASCGNSFPLETIQAVEEAQVENTSDAQMNWAAPENPGFSSQEFSSLRAYRCEACGAQILADETTAATECVYCGNPSILPGVLTGVYRPDGLIPFKKSKEEAQVAFRHHCQGKKLLPKGFLQESQVEKITGVYVPFWLYGCEAEADCTYNATKVSTHREGQYQVVNTAHFLVRRGGHMGFDQVPVNGSSKIDDSMMESIEPYDGASAQGFSIAYLSGFQAQRHDMDAAACQPRANERIRASVQSIMRDTVRGYASVQPANTQIQLQDQQVRQVLMPVWLLNTRFRGNTYSFAMNGQTGLFIGDLPTDKGRMWAWFLGLLGGISGGGFLLVYLLSAMGVL